MWSALKRHPFGVSAFFRRSLVLTYAMPEVALRGWVGPGLELDTYGDWGFVAIAMVETEGLRPTGFPPWLGNDFFLSGYRIFSRFVRPGKQPLRGLRILRSDTNRRRMATLGNVFTHYNYRHAEVSTKATADAYEVLIRTPNGEADLDVRADLTSRPAELPPTSPFRSMQDARTFAGPLPFTFSYDSQRQRMVVIKGLRESWQPSPVRVDVRRASFIDAARFGTSDIRLANAFYVENVPYAWKPGTFEELG